MDKAFSSRNGKIYVMLVNVTLMKIGIRKIKRNAVIVWVLLKRTKCKSDVEGMSAA